MFRARLRSLGTCTTCHNTPNVGSDSQFAMMNIGTGSPEADLPSYMILCNDGTRCDHRSRTRDGHRQMH